MIITPRLNTGPANYQLAAHHFPGATGDHNIRSQNPPNRSINVLWPVGDRSESKQTLDSFPKPAEQHHWRYHRPAENDLRPSGCKNLPAIVRVASVLKSLIGLFFQVVNDLPIKRVNEKSDGT